jgi:hypothetical protein
MKFVILVTIASSISGSPLVKMEYNGGAKMSHTLKLDQCTYVFEEDGVDSVDVEKDKDADRSEINCTICGLKEHHYGDSWTGELFSKKPFYKRKNDRIAVKEKDGYEFNENGVRTRCRSGASAYADTACKGRLEQYRTCELGSNRISNCLDSESPQRRDTKFSQVYVRVSLQTVATLTCITQDGWKMIYTSTNFEADPMHDFIEAVNQPAVEFSVGNTFRRMWEGIKSGFNFLNNKIRGRGWFPSDDKGYVFDKSRALEFCYKVALVEENYKDELAKCL